MFEISVRNIHRSLLIRSNCNMKLKKWSRSMSRSKKVPSSLMKNPRIIVLKFIANSKIIKNCYNYT